MGIIKAGERIDYITIMRLLKQLKDKEYSVKVKNDFGNIGYVRTDNLAYLTPDIDYDINTTTNGVFHTSNKTSTLVFAVLRDRSESELFFTGNPLFVSGDSINKTFHERLPVTKELRELYSNSNPEINDIEWDLEILIYPILDFASENGKPFSFNLGKPNTNYPSSSPRSNVQVYLNYDALDSVYVETITSRSNEGIFNAYSPNRYSLSVAKSFNISSFRVNNLHNIIKLTEQRGVYRDYSKHAGAFLRIPKDDIDLTARTMATFTDMNLRIAMVLNTNIFQPLGGGDYYLFVKEPIAHIPSPDMYTYDDATPNTKVKANYSIYKEFDKMNTDYMDDSTYPVIIGGITGVPDANFPVTQVLLNRMSETVYNDTFQSDFLYDHNNNDPVEANYRIIFGYSRPFTSVMDTENLDQAGLYYQCQTSEGTVSLNSLTEIKKRQILGFFPEILKKINLREVVIHS